MENYENIDIKTRKNKPKLQHEGFLYVYEKLNSDGDKKFWWCEQFKTREVNCHGRLHTTLEDVVIKTRPVYLQQQRCQCIYTAPRHRNQEKSGRDDRYSSCNSYSHSTAGSHSCSCKCSIKKCDKRFIFLVRWIYFYN